MEYWVTCDEFSDWYWCHEDDSWDDDSWDLYCDNEWFWDDCYYGYYRSPCEYEYTDWGMDSGWIFWDDWNYMEYWVTDEDWNNSCAYYY